MSICVLAERYGVKGQTPRKQYKEKISDYRNWDQLEHAHDYLLYPENIGENLSLDETCLSNGDVYTILTNKAGSVVILGGLTFVNFPLCIHLC